MTTIQTVIFTGATWAPRERPARAVIPISVRVERRPYALVPDLCWELDRKLSWAPWCTRTWLLGLTAEHEEVVERSGRRVTAWKQHYQRNEALDTGVYALAIAELVPRPSRRRARLIRV